MTLRGGVEDHLSVTDPPAMASKESSKERFWLATGEGRHRLLMRLWTLVGKAIGSCGMNEFAMNSSIVHHVSDRCKLGENDIGRSMERTKQCTRLCNPSVCIYMHWTGLDLYPSLAGKLYMVIGEWRQTAHTHTPLPLLFAWQLLSLSLSLSL